MAKLGIVRLDQIEREVRAAVEEALREDPDLFDAKPDLVFVRDPLIVGFISPDKRLIDKRLGQVAGVASRVGRALGGPGGLILNDGDLIVGFLPPHDILQQSTLKR